jgi:hypothetical protein
MDTAFFGQFFLHQGVDHAMPCELHLALKRWRGDKNTAMVRLMDPVVGGTVKSKLPEVCLSTGHSLHGFVMRMLM